MNRDYEYCVNCGALVASAEVPIRVGALLASSLPMCSSECADLFVESYGATRECCTHCRKEVVGETEMLAASHGLFCDMECILHYANDQRLNDEELRQLRDSVESILVDESGCVQ